MHGVATNVYSRKTSEKPERCGLRTLRIKGSGVVFMHGEGISTPRVCHKGRQPLIECANMTSILFYFPFYVFMSFYEFCIFYLFVVEKGVCWSKDIWADGVFVRFGGGFHLGQDL